ncbi:SulP family inorganic anion transporter [Siculibacillus lacustris]|uniref:SulP family inorganic anion transporter n=1 Tax=Siculibacillus lacustris TaxID=1549641 RepID=A0A4Q9VJJ9_9HYPH|nr:SulP family inorganic anion transporter [Siculibacillus lacustris]TBW35515.1 SulP family inorganic anion transporter [Siculibacillus lacustris]
MTDLSLDRPGPFGSLRKSWDFATLRKDTIAGVTVAAISLPQSMAYALVAGVDPRFGLYTAIVFTAVAGLFGSSRHLINGPTGAVSLVTFSALAFIDPDAKLDAYEAMFLLTVLIGIVQIVIGVTRLGDVTRYISESVVTGFIAGAGFLTIIGQVSSALGVKSQGTGNQHVLERLYLTLVQPGPYNVKAIALSLAAIAFAVFGRRITRALRLPQIDMLLAVIVLSGAAYVLGWSDAAVGAKPAIALIDAVPAALPTLHVPQVNGAWLWELSSSSLSIGILGLLEALAIAKAIAHQSRQELDYNRQCIAEGIGNLVGGFFRCMPGAGSLSRTAINYSAGAETRWSGVVTAVVVAIVVLLFGPLAAFIPKAVLAGLLMVAAARLVDVKRIRYTATASGADAVLLALTALSAVIIGVDFAILIGAAASIVWYLLHASRLKTQELVVDPQQVVRARIPSDPPAREVVIHDLEGDLFFGAAPDLHTFLAGARQHARDNGIKALVLRVKRVRNPDAVALEVLDVFLKEAERDGLLVYLAGVRPELHAALARLGIIDRLGEPFIYPEEETDYSATLGAIRAAYARLAVVEVGNEHRAPTSYRV